MNSTKHSIATGTPAIISTKEGGRYSAHGNYIKGKKLHLIRNKVIVQTWRAAGWDKNHVDSTFIICMEQKGNDATMRNPCQCSGYGNIKALIKDGMNIIENVIRSHGKNILRKSLSESIKM